MASPAAKRKRAEKDYVLNRFVNKVGFIYKVNGLYPVFQVPHPFRQYFNIGLLHHIGYHQPCLLFYKDFFKCAFEVGRRLEYEECAKELQDMRECETRWKTGQRQRLLYYHRNEQGLDYLDHPPRHLFSRPQLTFRKDTKN
ncbi:uncharacterized protein LOC133178363 [Saccostrea echinata]|uniref:uncharacterized protein LOC133178363 n=1 Tax=Saccostrea echinata TaxID=191078 RepID=UPI002A8073F5|nr:uncharacterized protein LOC133178363 [Saccostrea echinata]